MTIRTGYVPPVPQALPQYDPTWATQLCVVINALAARVNNAVSFTLTANAGTSTLTDPRITYTTAFTFTAQTANAAAVSSSLYVSSQKKGSAVIVHTNNANVDKTFQVGMSG